MNELRLEFETYTSDKMIKSSSQTNHWDIISSMYHAAWFAERMGFLEKEEVPITQQRLEGDMMWNDTIDNPHEILIG